jgi:hypothetical protein
MTFAGQFIVAGRVIGPVQLMLGTQRMAVGPDIVVLQGNGIVIQVLKVPFHLFKKGVHHAPPIFTHGSAPAMGSEKWL